MHGENNEIKTENGEMGNRASGCASSYKSVLRLTARPLQAVAMAWQSVQWRILG
jgi:hypothetical protein